MSKRMLIDAAQADEQRVVVLDGGTLVEADFFSAAKAQIKGNIYLARVTRVEPSLQAAFIDFGSGRHGFLPFSEIHPDYFQIPVTDREALLEDVQEALGKRRATLDQAEAAAAPADQDADETALSEAASNLEEEPKKRRSPRKKKSVSQAGETAALADDKPKKTTRRRKKVVAAALEEEVIYAREQDNEKDSEHDGEAARTSPSRSRRSSGRTSNSISRRGNGVNGRPSRHRDYELEDLSDAEFESRTMARTILQKKYRIQEVIKRNQVVLVQVVKEERGEKGAALTTYLSLPGRYCVLMPNTYHGGGISRRIASASDRKRLKSILDELNMTSSMSLIVRTAGAERTKQEIKRDFVYLTRTWDEVRETTLNSFAPTLIYEEVNLIKRAIRDIYESNTSEVLVEGAEAHKAAKAFMKTLTPSHAARVKLYKEAPPLFQKHGVEQLLESLNAPQVRLPSGGYLVFNQTEALVAVDVNSGRATRERNIEETALRTNLEAAQECARQLRLRDLAGLVVIDFIDMEDHSNVNAVERALKEATKVDRARIQLGRISQFGLMELSRQRLRPSVAETTMITCPTCQGTGFTKSDAVNARGIIRQIELALTQANAGHVRIIAGLPLALKLANSQRENMTRLTATFGTRIEIVVDNALDLTHFRCVLDRDGRHEVFGTEESVPSKPKIRSRTRTAHRAHQIETTPEVLTETVTETTIENRDEEKSERRRRRGKRGGRGRSKHEEAISPSEADQPTAEEGTVDEIDESTPKSEDAQTETAPTLMTAPALMQDSVQETTGEPDAPPQSGPEDSPQPKRRGWWNRRT